MEITERLRELHKSQFNGHLTEVLYKVVTWSHYLVHLANYTDDVYIALQRWIDKCDEESIDFFDSLILMYNTDGYLGTEKMDIYTKYTSHFHAATQYLLGDITWHVPPFVHQKAKETSLCYTRLHLNNLLELSPDE